MIKLERKKKHDSEGINIAPLIDMIFILLLFFIVNSAFVSEAGMEINRTSAQNAVQLEKNSVLVFVSSDETITVNNRKTELISLSSVIKQSFFDASGAQSVIIVPDKTVQSGLLIKIMDECKSAGAANISVAAEKKQY
ncbi:MAG TPA: biopolymer transporter ExbD [bacterium]|nr:biopolymer transporter ExbD [bacterium]HPN32632.1 biopolymer transporter ExbD [bacterium]